jgi:hypothetical protein
MTLSPTLNEKQRYGCDTSSSLGVSRCCLWDGVVTDVLGVEGSVVGGVNTHAVGVVTGCMRP